jgi:AcrR family transcriptional regulator
LRNTVIVLKGNGESLPAIARAIGISEPTLNKYYKGELVSAHADLKARMGAALVRQALAGNINALKFWLATHGGADWRVPKEDAEAMARALGNDSDIEPVQIYMPSNGRDEPDIEDDGPLIEGEISDAA